MFDVQRRTLEAEGLWGESQVCDVARRTCYDIGRRNIEKGRKKGDLMNFERGIFVFASADRP